MFQAGPPGSIPRLRHARAVSPKSADIPEWTVPATAPARRRVRRHTTRVEKIQLGGLSVVTAATQTTPSLKANANVADPSFRPYATQISRSLPSSPRKPSSPIFSPVRLLSEQSSRDFENMFAKLDARPPPLRSARTSFYDESPPARLSSKQFNSLRHSFSPMARSPLAPLVEEVAPIRRKMTRSPSPCKLSPSTEASSPSPSVRKLSSSPKVSASPRVVTERVAQWTSWLEALHDKIEHKDCRVPHQILVELQNDLLRALQDNGVNAKFLVQSVMTQSKPPPLKLPSGGQRVTYTKSETKKIVAQLKRIDHVLMEPGISFFSSAQAPDGLVKDGTLIARVENFLKEIKGGPFGGRKAVGVPCLEVGNFPVVVYATGPFDESHKSRLRIPPPSGPAKWTQQSDCTCPIRVLVLLEEPSLRQRSKSRNRLLEKAAEVLARLASDWQCHRLRMFYHTSARYQTFLPTIAKLSTAEMAKAGWSEMVFNGSNVIRWKTISGGLILAYLSGVAEASVEKTMALVYDGDNHKDWIPFVSETKRLFSLTPMQFAFGYGVSLPWPLNRREMTLMGMATDSLSITPMNAIQMWGNNVPEVATTCFGVPLPKALESTVLMEMPALSFSLTPVSAQESFLRMVAVIDVKINFLPMALQNYMAKHMATKMFGNVQRICKNFDKSPYRHVIGENKPFFEDLLRDVPSALAEQQRLSRR